MINMYKQILFLDIDGVMNSEQSIHYYSGDDKFCPIAHHNLKIFCKEMPDLKIVISSSWRQFYSLDELKKMFYPDIAERIISTTEAFSNIRGHEIAKWLKDNPTESFAILDDDEDMAELKDRLCRTNWRVGFDWLAKMKLKEIYDNKQQCEELPTLR